ncbi:MAG: NF038122 family metalloprotease [Betaproteobacteria bacterium]|nr:NF038122 family metalloprotease [Betaproteobacteria bacterium]MDE2623099.1 NF038122 family metalloprotease [Betaproteobacteria bacterium]
MQINLVWDSSTASATTTFIKAVKDAAQILSSAILNNITVNIQVGLDSIGGGSLGGSYAEGGPQPALDSYAQIISQLSLSNAQNGLSSLSSYYPSSDPSGGHFEISTAEAKAFGLMPATATGIDGMVGFSSQVMNSPYADMVDTALHELAHALGRANGFVSSAIPWYLPLDLYTYVTPGVLWNPVYQSAPGYFSTNGGVNNLGYFSVSDVGDFVTTQDAFGYVANSATTLSPLDKTVLMALGFSLAPSSSTVSTFLALASAGSIAGTYTLNDTAANVASHIDALQADVSGILWIALTDSNPLSISAAQLQNDSGVLSLIQGQYALSVTGVSTVALSVVLQNSHVTAVSLADTAADLSRALDILQTNAGTIAAITLTDSAPLTLLASQLTADAGALALVQGNYSINVYGASTASLASLLATPHVASVALSDSSQNIGARLDTLQSLAGSLGQITLTDSNPITLTAAQLTQDAGVLAKISGGYSLAVTGLPAADILQAAANSHIASVSVQDSLGNLAGNFQGLLQNSNLVSSINLTGSTVVPLSVSEWSVASGLVSKITNASLLQIEDSASHLNGLNLTLPGSARAEISLTSLDGNASLSGGVVSMLDLQGLGNARYSVSATANGQGTVVSVSTAGTTHTITLQNETPSQVAILTQGTNSLVTASYDYAAAQAAVVPASGVLAVQTPNGSDLLNNVQRLQFNDQSVAFDVATGQSAGQTAELLNAAFGNSALTDKALAGDLIHFFDQGGTLAQAAQDLVASGTLPTSSSAAFVSALWQHAVGSSIPASDLTLFSNDLANGTFTDASLLALAATASPNQASANLSGLSQTGLGFMAVASSSGTNSVSYASPAANYTVSANPTTGMVTVSSAGSTDPLIDVQRIRFSDSALAFDVLPGQAAGNTADLLTAATGLSSLSNKTLVGTTLALFDAGDTLTQAAAALLSTLNFSSPTAFVTAVWQNVMGSAIPAGELTSLTSQINSNAVSEAQLLAMAAGTANTQNQINLTGLQTHGLAYLAA